MKYILVGSIIVLLCLGITVSASSISGYVISRSGEIIPSGNIVAIVKETGNSTSSNITNGFFTINLPELNLKNKYTIGIFAKANNKTGYTQLMIGFGDFAKQMQSCVRKTWYFSGSAININGTPANGKIYVNVANETNSTNFFNGEWYISISPCLIPGELYIFKFTVIDQTENVLYIKQIAK